MRVIGSALAELLESESGPVMRECLIIGTRVRDRAKQLVGVGTARGGKHLRDAIFTRFARDEKGPHVLVGNDTEPHALLHHTGTRPHRIEPRKPDGLLSFYWPKVGRVVFFRKVDHPGTKPNPYLTRALREV